MTDRSEESSQSYHEKRNIATYIGCVKLTAKHAADPPSPMDWKRDGLDPPSADMVTFSCLQLVVSKYCNDDDNDNEYRIR
jgi:hypothetical protein